MNSITILHEYQFALIMNYSALIINMYPMDRILNACAAPTIGRSYVTDTKCLLQWSMSEVEGVTLIQSISVEEQLGTSKLSTGQLRVFTHLVG